MTKLDLKNLLPATESIARKAGAAIMALYKKDTTKVDVKQDGSFVTEADYASEAIILSSLRTLTPHIPVISEEAAAQGDRPDISGGVFWVVDPLDGTRGFKEGTGNFCVAIALIAGGKPVLGVVYAPVADALYSGAGPGTATKTLGANPPQPLSVRDEERPPRILVDTTSIDARGLKHYLQTEFGRASVRNDGTLTNLRAMSIAAGEADITVVYPKRREGRTKWWDVAPAHAIVEAAGGRIESLDGKPLSYDAEDYQVQRHVIRGGARRAAKKRKPDLR